MSLRPSRYRSSTSASTQPAISKATEVLQILLDAISSSLSTISSNGYPNFEPLLGQIRQVRQHLSATAPPSSVQDDFRHLRGFHRLFDVLRAFSGFYNLQKRSDDEKKNFFDLLNVVFGVLSAAFRGHPGNRRYFRTRVEDGGWEALEQIIASIGLGGSDSDLWTSCQLFGKLFTLALNDPALDQLCCSAVLDDTTPWVLIAPNESGTSEDSTRSEDQEIARLGAQMASIEAAIKKTIGPKSALHNSEVVRTIVDFWESLPRDKKTPENTASLLVLKILSSIIEASNINLCLVHETGVLSRFLKLAFDEASPLNNSERETVLALCRSLMPFGVNRLVDAQELLLSPSLNSSDFCLEVMHRYSGPPFIQFDLSQHGHSSIELPSIGRPFPPQSSAGYTFAAWVRIDQFDPRSHTTIFGAFDSTQTCFVLAYLEKDTHNFILQTSVTSQRPSVRFRTFTFKERRWYHITVVHRRPKTMTPSKASLYVNGEFVEQIRASYPASPPMSSGSTESFASFTSSSNKSMPVQAFLGTPRELSSHIGAGLISSKWSLGTAHLFDDVLSDDFLSVPSRLGVHYQGNFQDCLGGFQTYMASAALGLRNDLVSTGKEDSDIMKVIRDKASHVVPEHKILLSVLPSSVFREKEHFGESQLFRALSRGPAHTLVQMVLKNGTGIAINTALPSINDALLRSNGVAVLTGNPIVSTPQFFDDALWQLAGFTPLALKLIERASSVETLVRAVEMVFLCINSSWRNSEAMEKDGGYAILGILLKAKLGYSGPASESVTDKLSLSDSDRNKLCFQLLSLVLGFVGYKHRNPLDSVIVNPLAYRILLVDFDGWRKCGPIVQELYYRQFVDFAVMSKYHQYNNRRLLRMRIVKRLLDAVKSEPLSENVLPFFISTVKSLVKCNYNTEVHQSLALFITYSFHPPSRSLPRTPKTSTRRASHNVALRPLVLTNGTDGDDARSLTKREVGIRLLDVYSQLLCEKGNLVIIRKFAKTVTNKWLLYLLTENDPEIVVYGCKILARLLVTHGTAYTNKFAGKTGGFCIMAHRLKRWWDMSTLWPICFSILFGYDVAEIDFEKNFDFFSMLETFGKCKIVNPDALPIITAMIQHALKDILKDQEDPASPPLGDLNPTEPKVPRPEPGLRARARSMSLKKELETRQASQPRVERNAGNAAVLQTVIRFMADLHARSADFRDFALTSDYVRLLLSTLYPAIVSADPVNPETELNSRDSMLTFEGGDVIIRPVGGTSSAAPVIRTSATTDKPSPPHGTTHRGTQLRKASSFVLLTSQKSSQPSPSRLVHVVPPRKNASDQNVGHGLVEGILELIINVFIDQLLVRKEFPGFGLFLKVPPGFQEHQAYFESYVLKSTIVHMSTSIKLDWKTLNEPKVLTNMARFSLHMVEAIFEGWFMNGTESMLDFAGLLLEYLQKPEVAKMKTVRLCSQAVSTIRGSFLKLVLLRLSEMDDPQTTELEANFSMEKILYWQTAVFESLSPDDDYMKLFWYQLYTKLVDVRPAVRLAAVNLWRIMLVQKPAECLSLFRLFMTSDQTSLAMDFQKLTELDTDTFIVWVDEHRPSLDALFYGGISRTWEEFVAVENRGTLETAKSRLTKRKEILKRWHSEMIERDNILLRHDMANSAWMKSIYASEHFKHQRLMQDQQDDVTFFSSSFLKMKRDLDRPGAVLYEPKPIKWKLDRTEGRNRMRLRLLPDLTTDHDQYQPKRRTVDPPSAPAPKPDMIVSPAPIKPTPPSIPHGQISSHGEGAEDDPDSPPSDAQTGTESAKSGIPEDDFEMVDDPYDKADDGFEDKNRRVMRRLQTGDAVQQVYNVSRVIGLEAFEGILLVGKDALYIMDNFFQCADGEIVNVWEAPTEERDPFSQIITGEKSSESRQATSRSAQDSRSWKWQDVISISKRRFLFRDVAIEIFFTDGRSYLLTARNSTMRDEVFARLSNKTPHTAGASSLPNPEDAWRLESLKVFEESTPTFGSKFGSIFNSSPWNPLMRRWQRGEISNFHYLMLVNTMAGRTFNDLTQYPVFPWVLADYTSEELDLTNPATFRDLSKPMGAQTARRQSDYQSRYTSLAEIGETPFHYGTHYSSAMIVASYLIRLPPFVQSFILLQGGSFDHADRLFFSIEGSWKSASQDNGSDVRELIPEFFYLPDFLTNVNGYNFGDRQGSAGRVNHVELPPWAKGDPKIFVAKHREALESPYVSQHLHLWVDLIFGNKQRGEAAVENLNVFHYLSYYGAKDLDNITDSNERHATTSIIHNFGQTPHQVFTKPHPARESFAYPARRLDTGSQSLARIPHPLLESRERVSSLVYSPRQDRMLCSSPFRLNLPPLFDKCLEWGYADNSLRFFYTENRKSAGVSENLHIGQISCVVVADSKTLITAGEDCVVSVFTIHTASGKFVELQHRSSLFGHKTPVTTIAVSKAFSTLVTVSGDGHAFLWDLNRLEFVRKLPSTRAVECARINDVSGEIMLCSGPNVALYTINGDLMLDQNVCAEHDDYVYSCAFYEGSGNEWLENYLVFTGHRRGRVNIWKRVVKDGKWILELVRRLDHIDTRSDTGANTEAAITCITPMPQLVYTGDDDGRVYEWNLIQRER
ncbi:beach-domain-containing protein [Annulohypoxylon maeteangense]|uniref:beach-domain-containing protein n=1 Tax=Annulohypoxylon maeteangense TaxID=1927788 RepID=UPI00200835EC|nr:beach-domain-containing protein [Annulohypoxylon maeteangense]KAI0883952.1 beach-domain-containing protein [Annulohypoxylon maeteangense]